MRHDLFVHFTIWNGPPVWVNPDAVTSIAERKEPADETDRTRTYIYLSCGTAHNVREEPEEVVLAIAQVRESMKEQLKDAATSKA